MTKISITEAMQLARRHHQAGRLMQAEAMYRQVLQSAPDHPDALHLLGMIAHQAGQHDKALKLMKRAIESNALHPIYYDHCGMVLHALGKPADAIAFYRKAISLKPDYAEAHNNLGNALKDLGKLDQAAVHYNVALSIKHDFAEAHNNLGTVLQEQGNSTEAVANYRRALALKPGSAISHYNLGNALRDLGKLDEAAESYRKALTFKPDYPEAYFNLGIALQRQGDLDAAADCYRQAIALKPDYAGGYGSLGAVLNGLGEFDAALANYQCALALNKTPEFKTGFSRAIIGAEFTDVSVGVRRLVIEAISEPWMRPSDLAAATIRLIASNQQVKECIERASRAWPTRLTWQELFGAAGFAALSEDELLRALLENAPVCDAAMERLLTMVRIAMLDAAIDGARSDNVEGTLTFCCAIARQCFINDFVFCCSEPELERAVVLRQKLVTELRLGTEIAPLWVAAVAAYFPLQDLAGVDALIARHWPESVTALLKQQVLEPLEEQSYRADIRALTAVDDDVSRSVRRQYEEHPYPRWVKVPRPGLARGINSHVSQLFPHSPICPIDESGGIDVLIAGCGTGQESIETAQDFAQARVLAIDLSLASLCYAKRKASESGVENVEHAQGDIMRLRSIDRKFAVITSVGVLHHLADPMAGWRKLLALLRPDGFMLVGLYSERARRSIVAARKFIAERGYTTNATDIRRCRQDLISADGGRKFGQLASIRDFYVTGECRDLLFHVQEHRFVLPQIKKMLEQLGLRLIGFVLAPHVANAYATRFPDDRAMTDLDHWHEFEAEFPDAFAGMYVFWVQKAGIRE